MTAFFIWERGVLSDPDRDHEVPAICWDHRDPHILADRLRRQILAAEMEGR